MAEGYSLDGYIEVPDRILKFKEAFPEGSLQGEHLIQEIGGEVGITYIARAYRTADDERPGVGMAWEPFPGKTNYTKDSELMNAETSAWGRAIVALGFLAKDEKVASANEVRARQGNGSDPASKPELTDKQLNFIEKLLKGADVTADDLSKVRSYCAEKLTGGREGTGSATIEKLKGDDAGATAAKMVEAAEEWLATQSDVPPDTNGLEPQATPEDAEIPF